MHDLHARLPFYTMLGARKALHVGCNNILAQHVTIYIGCHVIPNVRLVSAALNLHCANLNVKPSTPAGHDGRPLQALGGAADPAAVLRAQQRGCAGALPRHERQGHAPAAARVSVL